MAKQTRVSIHLANWRKPFLAEGEYKLIIDYPLERPYEQPVIVPPGGMTRGELVDIITDAYEAIYKAEDETSNVDTTQRGGLLNRPRTNGKYGIWGHDLGDLDLGLIKVSDDNVITLGVDS